MITVTRINIKIEAKPEKVIAKYLNVNREDRVRRIVSDVLSLEEKAVEETLNQVFEEFENRHIGFRKILLENYNFVEAYITSPTTLSESRKLLLGSYFTNEYSVESAALFNPSIVMHPDQNGLEEAEVRFILSLRATGEGHISSIEFRSGIISKAGEITLDPVPSKLTCAKNTLHDILDSNYELSFDKETALGSRVIFPVSEAESGGMEDVRLVEFSDQDKTTYIGTYTAFNGEEIRSSIIETKDFISFNIRALYGKAAVDKGMALFPEKINGQYTMISRQGGENISIMYSDDLYFWDTYKTIQKPERDWEITQLGNCGSPVKTPSGWLLLTHGVGPMRKYVISASLLDLRNPEVVLATLDQPLIYPNTDEREGYVPNVVYTCGAMLHFDNLIIPYAMSDSAVSFARVDINKLIDELLNK
ncbi:MAG: glycoside hydrolase family 130 protein [Bacteroidales bacterium]|nr:glycoside hydrolase family 130 protein [Bacteroidales bacterium]